MPGARTVEPARDVARPGEQARVRVGIRSRGGVAPGTVQDGTVVATAHAAAGRPPRHGS
ncbi:hypothetical protein [Streptomyces sp. KL116D]|uniref:hypothetical protein n=1 Tax=Streptomyces sp. KL116D TaxID=3045152 RepID=UPI0035576E05